MRSSRLVYRPTREEIQERTTLLLIVRGGGWEERLITSIFDKDAPTVSSVLRLVKKYGPEEARRRILSFSGEQ